MYMSKGTHAWGMRGVKGEVAGAKAAAKCIYTYLGLILFPQVGPSRGRGNRLFVTLPLHEMQRLFIFHALQPMPSLRFSSLCAHFSDCID